MSVPFGAVPIGDVAALAAARPPAYRLAETDGAPFLLVELETYRAGGAAAMVGAALGELPFAAPPPVAVAAEDFAVLRASDAGYVAPGTDRAGALVYPPGLDGGIAIDRGLDLSIAGKTGSAAWGSLRLVSDDRRWDRAAAGRNPDGRPVRIRAGRMTWDPGRGLWRAPGYEATAELFAGIASNWRPEEGGLTVPLRDASALLEGRQVQGNIYGGTGGADGAAALAGVRKPKLRGGTLARPVLNVAPVRIDPVANVWAYNDGPGQITGLYENGAPVFSNAGNVSNLWAGSTPAGSYRTDNARGLFQLGSPTSGQITLDGVGHFPASGLTSTAVAIALRLLLEDLAIPAAAVESEMFTGLDAALPYAAGWYWPGGSDVVAAEAVAFLLASVGARLLPSRSGRLRAAPLRALGPGAVPAASYTPDHIVSLKRAALPAEVATPPYRLRWGYGHNHTPLTSGLNATLAEARKEWLARSSSYAPWFSAAVAAAYRGAGEPAPVTSALLNPDDAAAMATSMGALWGTARALYAVELPLALALRHDLGEALLITYPAADLDAGRLGVVVGEQLRLDAATSILQVLV